MRRAAGLLLITGLAGCVQDPVPVASERTGPVRCAPTDCLLPRPAGLRVQNEDGAPQFVDPATGARITVERFDLRDDPERATRLLDAEAEDLGLVARFTQPPTGPFGILVRGISGQRAGASAVSIDPDPIRVRLLVFENPATDHVLVLRAEGPASAFAAPGSPLDAVLDGVRLGPGF